MKAPFLNRFENTVVFRISRLFWHVFVWLACAAIVLGLISGLYSIIPTSKRDVSKEQYPPEVKVELSDFNFNQRTAPPPSQPTTQQPRYQQQAPQQDFGEPADPDQARYDLLIDSLAARLPYLGWETQGEWVITDNASYNYYRLSGQYATADNYRQFRSTAAGLRDNLHVFQDQCKLGIYRNRIAFVRMLFTQLDGLNLDSIANGRIVQRILSQVQGTVPGMPDRLKASFELAKSFGTDQRQQVMVSFAIRFANEYPAQSVAFFTGAALFLQPFMADQKEPALATLKRHFKERFGKRTEDLFSFTEGFNTILPQVPKDRHADALAQYFSIHDEKNIARNQRIGEIEQEHAQQLMEAEAAYRATEHNKAEARDRSWVAIAGGVVVVAMIALILAVLSMQRAITHLEVAISTFAEDHKKDRGPS